MQLPRFRRYTIGAGVYDVISGERPVYRLGRLAGIEQAGLLPGGRVLDVGCGTGLNLAGLRRAVGPTGTIVGVDASSSMLRGARSRCREHGWTNVELRRGDAGRLADLLHGSPPFDAVIATYSLSIIGEWRAAFDQAMAVLRPGGRMVVVDTSGSVTCRIRCQADAPRVRAAASRR